MYNILSVFLQCWLSSMQCACAMLSSVACSAVPYFSHPLLKGTIKKSMEHLARMFRFSLQHFSETFFILKRIKLYVIINLRRSLCKYLLLLSDFNES
jgi:hypothetical protein